MYDVMTSTSDVAELTVKIKGADAWISLVRWQLHVISGRVVVPQQLTHFYNKTQTLLKMLKKYFTTPDISSSNRIICSCVEFGIFHLNLHHTAIFLWF